MSEELLKAIIQLFAIVARERITDDERANIKDFLALHLNQEATRYYLNLFDEFCKSSNLTEGKEVLEKLDADSETQQFVDDWAKIMSIVKQVNQALTMQQKLVMVVKIIELVYADNELSERQNNLIFYIGQALKIKHIEIVALQEFVMGRDADELSSKNVLVIDEGSDGDQYAGPSIVAKNLTGLIAILRLPESETHFIKYLGISTLYLNSISIKSRKIDVFPTGSTIRGNKIEPIYYSDIIGKFLISENKIKISFAADHIFYHFKSGKAGLQNINIAEQGGKLVGLMGASGSGKSTLLNVLNGTEKPSSGRVIINGINIHDESKRAEGIIGYIPQDDLLMEDLTVFQNLFYAAKLCFGSYSNAQITETVVKVLNNLGLQEIQHLKVGSPLEKTISGGQRKRLNIGLELLRQPTVLFVDEPTSGLSSRDSENIMDLLKELSLRGKMVFVVIHQPSSDIFKLFDSLVILDSGGFQIYYGNPVEAVVYFQEIINAANKSLGSCPECGNINPEQIFNIIETKVVNEYGRLTSTRKISAGQWYQYFKQRIKVPRIQQIQEELSVTQRIPNWLKQLSIFFRRDALAKLANKQYLYITLTEAPILALFIAFMVKYYNVLSESANGYNFHDNDNIPVYFFMSVVVSLFFGLTVSAEEIFRDRKILKRERFLHLSRSSYLTSKVMVLFLISAIQTILFILVGNYVLEIPLTELRYWFILFSTSCFANMLGLNISSAFNSAVTIYILIPLLVIPQLLLSGVVIRFDKFNPSVGKPVGVPFMGEVMASRWAFEGYMVTQFKDNPFEKQFYNLDKTIATSDYKKVYFIPVLESKLTYCLSQRHNWRMKGNKELDEALTLLKGEITSEINLVGKEMPPYVNRLAIGSFDSSVWKSTAEFLTTLKQFYTNKNIKAQQDKEALIRTLTSTPEKLAAYEEMRESFQNKSIVDAVKNTATQNRIVEFDGKLWQGIFPIYQSEHKPKHFFDFAANLYQPTKHFMGKTFDTLVFNLAVIWVMTLTLFILLYFDALRHLISFMEHKRKYRKREKG